MIWVASVIAMVGGIILSTTTSFWFHALGYSLIGLGLSVAYIGGENNS